MYGVNIYLVIKIVIKGCYDNIFYSLMGEWCVRVMRWMYVYKYVYGYLMLLLYVDVYIVMYNCFKLMR